jgi:hypothetical protein
MHLVFDGTDLNWSYLPPILIFMVPKLIYASIFGLHLEAKVIRFTPGFEDGSNLDLAVVQKKREGPFVCPGTRQA